MKFGVREICDVVLKAKFPHKVGNKMFYKDEPVLFFDSLKTSTLEGASTTVYATGGRGNARLVAWEGDRTVTFTMEDALISPESFAVLSGAGITDASEKTIYQHVVETVEVYFAEGNAYADLTGVNIVSGDGNYPICVMGKDDYDNIITEPFYATVLTSDLLPASGFSHDSAKTAIGIGRASANRTTGYSGIPDDNYTNSTAGLTNWQNWNGEVGVLDTEADNHYFALVDYYVTRTSGKLIEITPDKFGGNYYLEASTLFRDSANGKDYPAEFIIPNCKIQSNFTFSMANSGDPSTFTFTIDAFPDYTKFNRTKKVFAAIQIIDDMSILGGETGYRTVTPQT